VWDMHVTKNAMSGSGAPGGQIEYEIYFSNQGNAAAENVIITEKIYWK